MNDGKICVSVCAETADEMIENIKRAEEFADIVEVRFDCLSPAELDFKSETTPPPIMQIRHSTAKPLISTFRPKPQGGHRDLAMDERSKFWRCTETEFRDVDDEFTVDFGAGGSAVTICSHHDFAGVPDDVEALFDRLARTKARIIKIAVQASDIADAITVWKLLDRKKAAGPGIIPIAMGEAGKWTRILGLAHGAFMTYASLGDGKETADGQISGRDLAEVYRVRQLDADTQVFGVIGAPVSQSLSPYIHNPAFAAAGLNAVFIPLEVTDLDQFMQRMVKRATREVELGFAGFSVTMPHKQAIMKHLDMVDPTAEQIGAVNTVMIEDGRLTGYNTDAHGFITPLKERFGDLRQARVGVFGARGAARACVFALKKENAVVTIVARDEQKALAVADEFAVDWAMLSTIKGQRSMLADAFDIIVDATPLGMHGPYENESLFSADELKGVKFVYDLVTGNDDTPIICEAKRAGVPAIGGIEMLLAQGAKQFEIWTRLNAPLEAMRSAVLTRIGQPVI